MALICRRLNVLPSQVFEQDAFWMRRTFALISELDRIEAMRNNPKRGGKLGKGPG